MLYAMLAYHVEDTVTSWSQTEDDALMEDLLSIHDRLVAEGKIGPAARLGPTLKALTLRGGTLIDGPFAETKEALLGLYVLDCADDEEAVQVARDLQRANPSAVYELRPIPLYIPGAPISPTAA